MEFFEIKYLTAWPGVWIRPHTADNNQVMKIHLGLQNPGGKFYMRAGNDTVHWKAGKAHLFDDSYLHEVNGTAVEGDGPRVVLDIKFTHPDLHRTRGLGTFTSMPQWHAPEGGKAMDINTRVPDLTNQLIEKLGALDGDLGRDSQECYMAVMRKYGPAHIAGLCADLGLDVRGNEMQGGTVTMDPDQFNKPPGKRECIGRLLKLWEEVGFSFYADDDRGGASMKEALKSWLSGETDTVPTAWVEVKTDDSGESDVSDMDYGSGNDPRLLGNTCADNTNCAKSQFCRLPESEEQHEGGHCRDCRHCAEETCKERCLDFKAGMAKGDQQREGRGDRGGGEEGEGEEEVREDEEEREERDEL